MGLIAVPERLPFWAYLVAGAGAFVVAKAARHGAGTDAPVDPATSDLAGGTPAPSSGGSLWDQFGGSGSSWSFPDSGVIPGVNDGTGPIAGGIGGGIGATVPGDGSDEEVPSNPPAPAQPAPGGTVYPTPQPPTTAPAPTAATYPAGTYGYYRAGGPNPHFRMFTVSGSTVTGIRVSGVTTGFDGYCTAPKLYKTATRFALSDGTVVAAGITFELVRMLTGTRAGSYVSTKAVLASLTRV